MTQPQLTEREAALLDALKDDGVLTLRDALMLRLERGNQQGLSIIGALRRRAVPETKIEAALCRIGVMIGDPGAVDDPLHPLHGDKQLPYHSPVQPQPGSVPHVQSLAPVVSVPSSAPARADAWGDG